MPGIGLCGLGNSKCQVVLNTKNDKKLLVQTSQATSTAGQYLKNIDEKKFPDSTFIIHFECYDHIRDCKSKEPQVWKDFINKVKSANQKN